MEKEKLPSLPELKFIVGFSLEILSEDLISLELRSYINGESEEYLIKVYIITYKSLTNTRNTKFNLSLEALEKYF